MMLLDMPPAQRCRVRLAIALCQLGGYLDRTGQPPPIGSLGVVVGDAVIAARPRRLGSQLAWVIACAEGGERGWDLRPADSVAMVPLEFSCDAGPPQGKDPHLSTDGCGHLNQPNPHAPALVAADLLKKLELNVEIVASDWGNLVIRRASKAPIDKRVRYRGSGRTARRRGSAGRATRRSRRRANNRSRRPIPRCGKSSGGDPGARL